MKLSKKIRGLSLVCFLSLMVISCIKDDDYSVPEINVTEPVVNVNIDIVAVKNFYRGFEPKIIEAGVGSTRELYLEAYVISSDEAGNFYKSLIIQDLPEDPRAGIAISTEATNLYTKYEPGRKIYLRVDGLYIGEYAGLLSIGILDGEEVGRMNVEDFEERILRSMEKVEIIPRIVSIPEISDISTNSEYMSTLIMLENVQFPDGLAGVAHYGNPTNTYSVNRQLENCYDEKIILRTSGFSDFKGLVLPEGNGSLTAVLSRFNTDVQLFIRDIEDVALDGPRCNEGGNGDIFELPFFEDFEGHNTGEAVPLNIEGWTNENINGGQRLFEVKEFGSNNYTQISARNSRENPCEVWLITPGLILPPDSSPKLNFLSKDGYYNGNALFVKISKNFNGDIAAATWENLNPVISEGNTDGYAQEFIPSGDVDLYAYAGETVHIAFQYLGSSSGIKTTYQIDEISVIAD